LIWGNPSTTVINIPVPTNISTIKGTGENEGKDQTASKSSTPKNARRQRMIENDINPALAFVIDDLPFGPKLQLNFFLL
jgi:hypothetical protein